LVPRVIRRAYKDLKIMTIKTIGPYEVTERILRGAESALFRARDTQLNRMVLMSCVTVDDAQAQETFKNNSQILASLNHPNIVRVLTVANVDGQRYLVVEDNTSTTGVPLSTLMNKGPIEPASAVRILKGVLLGLSRIHAERIFLSVITPEGILIDSKTETAQIIDFGLAGDPSGQLDITSPATKYVAPFKGFGPRTDLYSLGIVAYEMLLGQTLFRKEFSDIFSGLEGESGKKWANWHYTPKTCNLASVVNPAVPERLADVIARMMSKDEGDFYRDAKQVLGDLEKVGGDMGESDNNVGTDDVVRDTVKEPSGPPIASRLPKPAKPRSKKIFYFLAATLLILAAVVFVKRTRDPVPFALNSLPGSDLHIGHYTGKIPAGGTLQGKIPPATYDVRIDHSCYAEFKGTYDVKPFSKWVLNATLTPLPKPAASAIVEVPSSAGPMVLVPAGEMIYGNASRKTSLNAFYIDKTEVTNGAYKAFCDATKRRYPPNPPWDPAYFAKTNYPVVAVSWDDATAFAAWAGKRLPTELEWEKAARGTDGRPWPWGVEFVRVRANLGGTEDGYQYAAPVGSFPAGASPYGLLDMSGNVWEWVADAYDPVTGKSLNDLGNDRVLKGGSFVGAVNGEIARAYVSGRRAHDERPDSVGFRCAKEAGQDAVAVAAAPCTQ